MSFNKCKNLCKKHPSYDPRKKINLAYENGYVRCKECICYFQLTKVKYCPCCKGHLTYKNKMKNRREIARDNKRLFVPMRFVGY